MAGHQTYPIIATIRVPHRPFTAPNCPPRQTCVHNACRFTTKANSAIAPPTQLAQPSSSTGAKELKPDLVPSRLFIYQNERVMEHSVASDSGAQIRDGIKSVGKQGDCPEAE